MKATLISKLAVLLSSTTLAGAYVLIQIQVLGDHRRQNERIEAASHLRQIGTAMMMYANQERCGSFPRAVFSSTEAMNAPTAQRSAEP